MDGRNGVLSLQLSRLPVVIARLLRERSALPPPLSTFLRSPATATLLFFLPHSCSLLCQDALFIFSRDH